MTVVENKIPDISSLVKKKDYAKMNEIKKNVFYYNHDKCSATTEFNKFPAEFFATRLA